MDLGPKCLQLLGMHALSGCDTTSYLYSYMAKGRSVRYIPCLLKTSHVKWTRTTHTDLAKFVHCIVSFQGHQWVSLLQTLSQSDGPTSNLLQLALRAYLQTTLWKAADHQGPPNESADITHFGWEQIRDDIPIPVIAQGDAAPPELIDVIQCQCRAQGKKCSTEACLAHQSCCNPHTTRGDAQAAQAGDDAQGQAGDGKDVTAEDCDVDMWMLKKMILKRKVWRWLRKRRWTFWMMTG